MTTPHEPTPPRDEPARAHGETQGTGSAPGGAAPTAEPVRDVFKRALRDVLILLAVLAVVGTAAGALLVDDPSAGVWGAVLGVLVILLFSGSTVLAMLLTARSSLTTASAAVVGTWLVKTLLLLVALSVLRGMDFYDRAVLGTVVIVGVLGSVVVDYRAVTRGRVPYVEPRPGA